MRTPHKLAAVLFADITGYTTMMASNEALALEKLSIFKSTIKKAVLTHSGKVVQYFGDGCLITFDSSALAVDCAVSIQEALGKGTLVPVRLGVHIGDVVFKEGNVYGDAVNIASRIESIGQPGTILVSSSIRNHVRSSSEYEFQTLGKFDFKNIEEPIEVYALSNKGFVVPPRSSIEGKLKRDKNIKRLYKDYSRQLWFGLSTVVTLIALIFILGGNKFSSLAGKSHSDVVKEEGIVLFDFKNNTGDSLYDNLQCEIHRNLNAMFKGNNIKVQNNSTLCTQSIYNDAIRSQFPPGQEFELFVKSKYALDGKISLENDSLIFQARIFRTLTNESVFVPIIIVVHKENPKEGLRKLMFEIFDSWKIMENPFYTENPPLPEWDEEYKKAIYYFEGNYNKVLLHLENCKRIDSTQYRADLLALEVYEILGMSRTKDSLLSSLNNKRLLLTEAEANLLNVHNAIKNKNYKAAFTHYQNEYENDPKNPFVNFAMMSYAVKFVNNSKAAVEIGEEIPYKILDYYNCRYCQDRLTFLARALIENKQYKDALDALVFATEMEIDSLQNSGNMELQIRALVRMGDEDQLKETLETTKHKRYTSRRDYPYFLYWTANEYALIKDENKAKKHKELFEKTIDNSWGNKIRTGRLHLNFKQYGKAVLVLREVVDHVGDDNYREYIYKALLGYALAKSGNINEAKNIIEYLERSKTKEETRPENLAYFQAQISTGLNNYDEAINYLREALAKGKHFNRWEFQYDPIFIDLMKDERFERLINNI